MRQHRFPGTLAAVVAALAFFAFFFTLNVSVVHATQMCDAELDAVLVLDGSGSMSGNYHSVQQFAVSFVSKFKVPPSRFAVIQYGSSVSLKTSRE